MDHVNDREPPRLRGIIIEPTDLRTARVLLEESSGGQQGAHVFHPDSSGVSAGDGFFVNAH
jgi:hypothetical protein